MRWRRVVYGPICTLFGHDAMGLLATGIFRADRDTCFCACTRREMSYSYVVSTIARRR